MTGDELFDRIEALAVVPVVEIEDAADAVPLARTLAEAGLPVLEVTFRTQAAERAVAAIAAELPDFLLGAGTLLTPDMVVTAEAAGARFGVAPGFSAACLDAAEEVGLPFVPGAVTPTEVTGCLAAGARHVKFFPAAVSGGIPALAALEAPFAPAGVRFMPTGGVGPGNAAEYLSRPAVFAVGGTWVAPRADISARRWQLIGERARAVAALRPAGSTSTAGSAASVTGGGRRAVEARAVDSRDLDGRTEDAGVTDVRAADPAALDPAALDPAPGELPSPATRPTMYFIGVTTGRSSIRTVFPRWADELGLGDVPLVGIDLPPHAPPADYRRVVEFIAADPLSLGALVTTHKIDLYLACRDLFDEVDPLAGLMGEVSSLSKRDGRLVAHAKDPISSGLAIDAFLPAGYWARTGAEAFLMGAGGSAIAISWYLTRPERGADRPSRIVVSNRGTDRLDALCRVHAELGTDIEVRTVHTPEPGDNDAVLAGLPAGSLVVNATGLGKDAPGSPLADTARWPADAIAWDLNYRGELVFLDQARAAGVTLEDGWVYFLHGWTQVIAEVFGVTIPTEGPRFDELGRIAGAARR